MFYYFFFLILENDYTTESGKKSHTFRLCLNFLKICFKLKA